MSDEEREQLHRDLGVYVLGALERREREQFERHLADCQQCGDELAHLAALPPLLRRLDQLEDAEPPPLDAVLARLGRQRRRERRHNQLIGAAAALVAVVAALVVAVALPPQVRADQDLYADRTGDVTAVIVERPWGMAVQIAADELPGRRGYVAYAVAPDGHRVYIASWRAVEGPVELEGSCYLSPDDVVRVEIDAAPDDEVIWVLRRS